MIRATFLLLLLAACTTTAPPAATPPATAATKPAEPVSPAVLAEIARIEKVLAEEPSHLPYMYILARYYDMAGDVPNAVRWLEKLETLGWQLGIAPRAFSKAIHAPEFQRVAETLNARVKPVSRASEAFRLPVGVRSEGIAYDSAGDVFFLSAGAGTLHRVTRSGAVTEFPIEPAGAKYGRLGMHVDPERRLLWAVSAAFSPDVPADEKGRSALSAYDLRDGRLVRRVRFGSAEQPAFFNDLAILPDGTIFVTDTTRHQVFRLAPDATEVELWAEGFYAPNGIVASADGRTLYVADFRGIDRIDIATKSRALLQTATLLNGIDGLAEHHGKLLGIHNVLGWPRVVRVDPETAQVEVLEVKNPLLDVPATCVVVGDALYFLANLSQRESEKVMLRIPL